MVIYHLATSYLKHDAVRINSVTYTGCIKKMSLKKMFISVSRFVS